MSCGLEAVRKGVRPPPFNAGKGSDPFSHSLLTRPSFVIGVATVFLWAAALGCGGPPPTAKPSDSVPPTKSNEGKESKPPKPDPG